MKIVLRALAIVVATLILAGCSSEPENSDVRDALETRAYDFINVVDARIQKIVKIPNEGVWANHDVYRIKFDYDIEFLKSYAEIESDARKYRNQPLSRAIRSMGGRFKKGDNQTVSDAEGLLVGTGNLTLFKIGSNNRYNRYLDFSLVDEIEGLSELLELSKKAGY